MVATIILYLGMFIGLVISIVVAACIATLLPFPLWAKIVLGFFIFLLVYLVIGGVFCFASILISKIEESIRLSKMNNSDYDN